MYNWRKINNSQREELLNLRKLQKHPWHGPPHRKSSSDYYHITAACYEHKNIIGKHAERMSHFEWDLVEKVKFHSEKLTAWSLLPNHYHLLVKTKEFFPLLKELGRLHGISSHQWNGEDKMRGRKVWCGIMEHGIKSNRHFWATVNYIHNNPVKHGYVKKWHDWCFSNSKDYLEAMGEENAREIWIEYDTSNMGAEWDPPEL
jgi:putative transposase